MSITASAVGGILLAHPTELPQDQVAAAQLGTLLGWASASKQELQTFGASMAQVVTVLGQIGWTVAQSDQQSVQTTSAQLSAAIWAYAATHSAPIPELQKLVENIPLFGSVGDFWWGHSFQRASEIGIGVATVQDTNGNTTFNVYGFSLPPADWRRLLITPSSDEMGVTLTFTSFILNAQVWEQAKAAVAQKSTKVQNLMSPSITSVA